MSRPVPAVVVLASLLLGGCSIGGGAESDEPPAVATGEVVEGWGVLTESPADIEVRLPSGPAYFDIEDDLDAVPADDVLGEPEGRPAASDTRLVHVAWTREFLGYGSDVMRLMTGSDNEDVGLPVALVVDADGRRTEIPDVGRLAGIGDPDHVYVGVPRDAQDLTLEVSYDGVTQTVDLATGVVESGRAAGLYDVPLSAERSIGDGSGDCPYPHREQGLDVSFFCGVLDSWQVPYVDGLGWAGEGRAWLVADASGDLNDLWWVVGDDFTDYRTRRVSWEVVADGSRPVGTLPRRLGNTRTDKRVVFAVVPRERHRLDFRATYVGRPVGEVLPGAPPRPTVRVSRSLRIPQPDDGS